MTIAEVCKQCDVSPDTLRYYERIGLVPPVARTAGGIRNYTETDVNWVRFAKCMRRAGLSCEALVKYVALFRRGDATLSVRKGILVEQRDLLAARLTELQEVLVRLNAKIENYERKCVAWERKHLRSGGEITPAQKRGPRRNGGRELPNMRLQDGHAALP